MHRARSLPREGYSHSSQEKPAIIIHNFYADCPIPEVAKRQNCSSLVLIDKARGRGLFAGLVHDASLDGKWYGSLRLKKLFNFGLKKYVNLV